MNAVEELLMRAESVADGFMAQALQKLGDEAQHLTEQEIRTIRESFKTGWLKGFAAGVEEVVDV